MQYRCQKCQTVYPIDYRGYRCACGGLFDFHQRVEPLDFSALRSSCDHSLWRYRQVLPAIDRSVVEALTMGEGGTPLVRYEANVWGKADYQMPTLSFKDRGAVVLVAMMQEIGVKRCIADSSGNAGTAIAAYCARAAIACDVFVPASTSAKKVEQIEAHGAVVHRIPGTREDTARSAIAEVEQSGGYYASHIFNPLFHEGTKTYVYELYEQLGGQLPDILVVPVGNGTLLLGVALAVRELHAWGYLKSFPTLVAVQAANCAPLATSFSQHSEHVLDVLTKPTIAEGIASARPARGAQILAEMRALDGRFVTVGEQDILAARSALASRGSYVELTSAANYAGWLKYKETYVHEADRSVVFPLCGAGLKSAH
jgi:threonine synthase